MPNQDAPSTFKLGRLHGKVYARELHRFLEYIEALAEGGGGSQGPQGPQGAAGAVGAQGVQGAVGATGSQGAAGTTGAQGASGLQGTTGAQGTIGATGAQGSVGATGAQGSEGAQGATGPAPWTFIGAYDNGVSYNLGDAVTYEGGFYYRTGNPLNPGYPPTPGSINASWTPVADGGAQGAQGPQGVQGDAGPQGSDGPQGYQGDAGPQGPQGDTGPQGAEGAQGATGAQGADGAQGVQGSTGAQGPAGYPVTAVYGSFSSSADQPLAHGVVTVAQYTTTDIAYGVSVQNDTVSGLPTRLVVVGAGTYSFCISPQIYHTGGGTETVTFWARVNGVDVPNSASSIEMGNNNNRALPYIELIMSMTAGQYVEWAFTTTNGTTISLENFPAVVGPPAIPAIPSVIATVKLLGS